ncbi:MAG: formate dehydrogenase accessory sulfurtransferase FdhD [Acidobacteriota bacterium]
MNPGLRRVRVERVGQAPADDWVIEEAPLEMRLDGESLAVTLRTPGHDLELAAGYLFTEGIVRGREDFASLKRLEDPTAYDPDNVVDAALSPAARRRHRRIEGARRRRMSTSACGLCGKARLEEIYQSWPTLEPIEVEAELARSLPRTLERHQELFPLTGGVHAAALFDLEGGLLALREDVGRHNALDKLIGRALLRDELPWRRRIVAVSARAGFEIVQKTLMAAAPALVAVGAGSSLAIDAARRGGLVLFTFVRHDRSNRHL